MAGGGRRRQHGIADARDEGVCDARVPQQLRLHGRQQHLGPLWGAQQLDVALQVDNKHIQGLAEGLQEERGQAGRSAGRQVLKRQPAAGKR